MPNLRNIPRTIFHNVRHVRIVLDFEMPLKWDGNASSREAEKAAAFEKVARDHPGIDTLILSISIRIRPFPFCGVPASPLRSNIAGVSKQSNTS